MPPSHAASAPRRALASAVEGSSWYVTGVCSVVASTHGAAPSPLRAVPMTLQPRTPAASSSRASNRTATTGVSACAGSASRCSASAKAATCGSLRPPGISPTPSARQIGATSAAERLSRPSRPADASDSTASAQPALSAASDGASPTPSETATLGGAASTAAAQASRTPGPSARVESVVCSTSTPCSSVAQPNAAPSAPTAKAEWPRPGKAGAEALPPQAWAPASELRGRWTVPIIAAGSASYSAFSVTPAADAAPSAGSAKWVSGSTVTSEASWPRRDAAQAASSSGPATRCCMGHGVAAASSAAPCGCRHSSGSPRHTTCPCRRCWRVGLQSRRLELEARPSAAARRRAAMEAAAGGGCGVVLVPAHCPGAESSRAAGGASIAAPTGS